MRGNVSHRDEQCGGSVAFKNILDDQITLRDDNQQSDVRPREQAELLHVILLDQRQDEPDEADAVQAERQESMVRDQEPQGLDLVEQNSAVVEQTFAIEKVV